MLQASKSAITRPLTRESMVSQLRNGQFDVLIIGGGATGAGAALDGATRGLKVALLEANDYASGSSSRSTKLVHGGVRYLENAIKHLNFNEYELVRDALAERKIFLNNAPHLSHALPILTPVYSWFEAFYYLMGLKLYDILSGKASLGNSAFLSKTQTLKRFNMVKKQGLKGSVVYYDGQFNDARMNITVILTALREGALALNYARVVSLIKDGDIITGAMVRDEQSQETWPVFAKIVINATGPFSDSIRHMDSKLVPNIMLASQGTHILLPERFSSTSTGLVIPKTSDGRVLFLLPWLGKTLVGTTDNPEPISELPKAHDEEIEYILEHVRRYIDIAVSRQDILATWSGLRPLVKPAKSKLGVSIISRDHLIEQSHSKLITIVGGKWTTYRLMGEEVIDLAIKAGALLPHNNSLTKNLKLVGAGFFKEDLAQDLNIYEKLDQDISLHLAHSYGDLAKAVIDVDNKSRRARLVEGYPFIEAEVIYAVTNEFARHPCDILARRMRLAFLDHKASLQALPKVVNIMASKLNWSPQKIADETREAKIFLATMFSKPKF